MKTKRASRLLSMMLCLCMLFSTFPLSGMTYAAETSCPNHQEHTQDCGYVQAQAGAPCKHEQNQHDENCGCSAGTTEVACNMGCPEVDGQIIHAEGCAYTPAVPGNPCKHEQGEHDENCGYIKAVEGAPCTHTCEKCDGSAAACTTEGCTLPAGHDGECAMAVALDAPVPANDVTSGKCGDDLTWSFDGGLLTISGSGGMYNYYHSGEDAAPWLNYRGSITAVELEEGITYIGEYAFGACGSLPKATFPTSLTEIGLSAFAKCSKLSELTFLSATAPTIQGSVFSQISDSGTIYFPHGASGSYTEAWKNNAGLNNWTLEEQDAPAAEGGITITASDYGEVTYTQGSGFTLTANGSYTVSGTWSGTLNGHKAVITVPSGVEANVTLDGVTINVSGTSSACAFEVKAGGTANLTLSGDSTLKSGQGRAGLEVPAGGLPPATLTISGSGKMTATGGQNGAGIGGGSNGAGGSVAINGATVEALGGQNGAGIGGGSNGDGGSVAINGATVEALGGQNGAGIGGGSNGDGGSVAINGATVIVTGGGSGADIGGGSNGAGGSLSVTDGATLTMKNTGTNVAKPVYQNCTVIVNGRTTVYNENGDPVPELIIGDGYTFNPASGKLTISSNEATFNYRWNTSIDYENDVTSVVVEDSVTNIRAAAFQGCKALISVILPDGITSIKDRTFVYCTSLKQIRLPSSVTSIGEYAFYDNEKLALTNLPRDLETIGNYAFQYCDDLALTELPSRVTSIGYKAFSGCTNLALTALPNGVTSIDYQTFEDCANLKQMAFPADLTFIGSSAFANCDGLTSLEFSDNSALTTISNGAFFGCKSLASLDLSGCANLNLIGDWTFNKCKALVWLALPASLQTIGQGAFNECGNLSSITFEGNAPPQNGTDAFNGIAGSGDIFYPFGAGASYTEAWRDSIGLIGWRLQEQADPTITTLTVNFDRNGSGGTSLTENEMKTAIETALTASDADRTKVVTIQITGIGTEITGYNWEYLMRRFRTDSGWTSLNTLDLTGMTKLLTVGMDPTHYLAAYNLVTVRLPDSLTSIGARAFDQCKNLSDINLPDGLQSIGDYAFWCDESLALPSLPDGLKSIGEYAFIRCPLTLAELPDGLQSIGANAFFECSGLTLTELPGELTTLGAYAFGSCTGLTSMTLPASLTALYSNPFAFCTNITAFYVAEGNPKFESQDGVVYNKGKSLLCFSPAAGLSGTFTVPNTVIDIAYYGFASCVDLTAIILPEGLTKIRSRTFYDCENLTALTFLGNQAPNNIERTDFGSLPAGGTIRFPAGATSYTEDWKDNTLQLSGWTLVPAYRLTVENGTDTTGGGIYSEGEQVQIKADAPPQGKVFDQWVSSDGDSFANANSADTSFTMPGKNVTVTAAYKDVEAPTGEIILAENHWKTFLNTISFGLFFKGTQDVTITAEDTSGEAVTIEYFLSADVLTLDAVKAKTEGWKSYKGTFTIDPDGRFIVYARLTDTAGNSSYLSSEGVVLDATPPAIEGAQDGQTYDTALNITVTDAYLETVTVNGTAQPVKDGQSALALTENGEYTIIAKDKAGNETTLTVRIELPPTTYILTFDANGGTPVPEAQTLKEGDKPAAVDDPAKEGYTFLGWYDGETKVDLNLFTMPAGNVTLTAHFEKIIESNITLSIPFTVAVEQGGNMPAPSETFTFAASPMLRDGMTEEEAAQLKADFAAAVTVEANSIETDGKGAYTGLLKLTASEEKLGRYLADGFMVTEVKGSAENWTYDDTAYQVIPQRDDDGGYDHFAFFKGEKEAAAMTFTNTYTKNAVTPPVTYYTLAFETNGGSRIDSLKEASGTVINLAEYKPTREGYEFGGWYADKDLKNAVTSVTLDSDKTVYAKWTKEEAPHNIPQTGDTSNMLPFVLLALASLLGCIGLISYKKLVRKKQQG